jgi:hypothetical protein
MLDGNLSAAAEVGPDQIADQLETAEAALKNADALVAVAWTSLEAGETFPEAVRLVLSEHVWSEIEAARKAIKAARASVRPAA